MDDKLKDAEVTREIDEIVSQLGESFGNLVEGADDLARNSYSEVTLERYNHQIKVLESCWYDFGGMYRTEREENHRLRTAYNKERHKSLGYLKYIAFLKDNQNSFAKLRDMYEKMKVLEGQCKTDEGCQTCNDLSPPPKNLNKVQQTLDSIRALVQQRERRHQENNQKIKSMSSKITTLEELNDNLMMSLSGIKRTVQYDSGSITSESNSGFKVELRSKKLQPSQKPTIAPTKSEYKCPAVTDVNPRRTRGYSAIAAYRSKDEDSATMRKTTSLRRVKVDGSTTSTGCRLSDKGSTLKEKRANVGKVEGDGKSIRRTGEKKEVAVLRKIRQEIETKKKKLDSFCERTT